MVLTIQDIQTIQKLGYDPRTFVTTQDSWLQLRNTKGRCVFHNGTLCTIYERRPEGCVLYPIVFDKDHRCAIYDSECPQKQCFPLTPAKEQQLQSLIQRLEAERAQRIQKKLEKPMKSARKRR